MLASMPEFWRSSVAVVSTAREMPELSLSSETCIATIPISATPTRQIHARPRRRRSMTRWSGSPRRRSKTPVTGGRGAGTARGRRAGPETRRCGRAAGRAVRARAAWRCWAVAAAIRRLPVASLRDARSRADFARGFWAISPGVGTTERRKTGSASGVRPHAQTGRSGGQMQPWARSARKRLTRRSSSEWNEIAASRPPGRSACQASGSASSSWSSSPLTAIRIAWKERLAGCPPPKRAGAGIAAVIASTSSKVVASGPSSRRRTISRAIRSA